MSVILAILTVLILVAVGELARRRHSAKEAVAVRLAANAPRPVSPGRTPPGVFFDSGHTWLFLEESGIAKVGVDEFARSLLGKIDDIETLPIGERVAQGEVILRLRHADRTAAFRAPIDGVVKELNTHLLDERDLSAKDVFTDAWLCRLRPTDSSQVPQDLMLGDVAKKWLGREVQRLKVFLATLAPQSTALGQTMQDGGLPKEGLVEHLSKAEWRKLQISFFG